MKTVHVGRAIRDWMWTFRRPPLDPATRAMLPLLGLPVFVETHFPDGRWEIRDDGNVIAGGQVGPDNAHVFYVPRVGFFSIDPADLEV